MDRVQNRAELLLSFLAEAPAGGYTLSDLAALVDCSYGQARHALFSLPPVWGMSTWREYRECGVTRFWLLPSFRASLERCQSREQDIRLLRRTLQTTSWDLLSEDLLQEVARALGWDPRTVQETGGSIREALRAGPQWESYSDEQVLAVARTLGWEIAVVADGTHS